MGTFAASISVYGASQQEVVQALQTAFPDELAIVTAEVSAWVGVFTPDLLYDPEIMRRTGSAVSKAVQRPALGIRIIHSEILCYYVWDGAGILVDSSEPCDEDQPTEDEAYGLVGQPEAIDGLFGDLMSPGQFRAILEMPSKVRDQNLGQLGEQLNIQWLFEWYDNLFKYWRHVGDLEIPRKEEVVTLGFQFPSTG